ncbi:MAG: hypothetical protein HY537_04155, partial [Deltaproteobacteria bacterium]|nr:hypothetical protein [Deltaproteobacteria bacterium]
VTLTVERDLKQIPGFKFDSKLARQILERVATLDEPTAGRIASALGKDPRTIMKHLEAFETLFVLHKILPFTGSTGKPQYYLCDVGIAKFLGASFPRLLETTLLLHILSAISWQMESRKHLSFYRTSKGSQVSLLITEGAQTTAIRILAEERFDLRNIAILLALRDKFPTMKTIVLGPERLSLRKEKVEIYPWESMD